MARFKIQGFLSLQLMLVVLSTQIIALATWPSFKAMLLAWQARSYLNQLAFQLSLLRSTAIILNKNLYLRPRSFDNNWGEGWMVHDEKKQLWQKTPYHFVKISIKWHGFEQNPPLVFYPDCLKNHVNGYFEANGYRLWVNRLGHTRLSHVL